MAQKILPVVNISKLYAAHLLTEEVGSITFDTPKYLEGVKELGIKPKQNSDPYYHEGRKIFDEQTLEDIAVTINITDLSDEDECYVMGHTLAKTGGIVKNDNDIAPTLAFLYEAEKAQGIKQYGILYAGTCGLGDEDIKDKEGKTNFQTKQIQASFRPLVDGRWQYKVSSDSPNVTEEFLANFFKQVTLAEEAPTKVETPAQ